MNATDYIKRNTTSPSYEAVDNRNSKIRVELDRRPFILETSASLDVTVLTQSAAADPDPAESQTNRNLDLMTLSFVVASLFLVVMLLIFSFLAVFVFCRCSKRGGGRGRRWPTQKSLLSVGENDDNMTPVLSTASSVAVTANAKHCGTDMSSEFYRYRIQRSTYTFHLIKGIRKAVALIAGLKCQTLPCLIVFLCKYQVFWEIEAYSYHAVTTDEVVWMRLYFNFIKDKEPPVSKVKVRNHPLTALRQTGAALISVLAVS